jgi:hypothetical protein
VDRYGAGLHRWQLAPGMAVAGLGMVMVQIGLAAGIAAVGTLLFSLLDDGVGFVAGTRWSLWLEIGLFLASAGPSFLLPAGPVRPQGPGAPTAEEPAAVA